MPFKQFNIALLTLQDSRVCASCAFYKACTDLIIHILNRLEGVTLMCVITRIISLELLPVCVDTLIESEQPAVLKAMDKFDFGASESTFLFY